MKNQVKIRLQSDLRKVDKEFVYRLFYPQVPIIVCSKSKEEVAAMPANSCMPVSTEPAIIALSVNKESRTDRVIRASGKFTLNWLNYKSRRAREYTLILAKPSQDGEEKDKLSTKRVPYRIENGQPFLLDAVASVLCNTVCWIECGDHDMFLAKVIWGKASNDFFPINYWKFRKYKPILYLGSEKAPPLTTLRN